MTTASSAPGDRGPSTYEHDDLYAALAAVGLDYGPELRGIATVRVAADRTEARAELVEGFRGPGPAVLDVALQVLAVLIAEQGTGDLVLPAAVGRFEARAGLESAGAVAAGIERDEGGALVGWVEVLDGDDRVLAVVHGIELAELGGPRSAQRDAVRAVTWQPVAVGSPAPGGRVLVVGRPAGPAGPLADAFTAAGWTAGTAESITGLDDDHAAVVIVVDPSDGCPERTIAGLAATVTGLEQGAGGARLWIVTVGGQPVSPGEDVAPGPAAVWGFGRSVAIEAPRVWGGLLDLPADWTDADAGAAAAAIAGAADHDEDQLAVRGGRVLAARVTRPPSVPTAVVALRADATYVVTGGFGAIGSRIALALARAGARRLALLSRTALPPRSTWASIPGDERVTLVRELEALGCAVHADAVDVAAADQVDAWLAAHDAAGYPPVRGVVHAAGVRIDRLLADLDDATIEAVWRPCAGGAAVLAAAFDDRALDLFVLVSSAAALLGSPGQAHYAAANAYLDGVAAARAARGRAGASIQLGVVADAGMAADAELLRRLAAVGLVPLAAADAADAVLGLAGWPGAVAVVPLRRSAPTVGLLRSPTYAALAGPSGPAAGGGPPAALESAGDVTAYLQDRLAPLLGITTADLDPAVPLVALGVDSLVAVELRNAVERDTGVRLPLGAVLGGGPLAELAGRFLDQQVAGAELGGARGADATAELSYGQRALWFLQQLSPRASAYNVGFGLRLRGSAARLPDEVLDALVRRHPSLRTRFVVVGGRPERVVDPDPGPYRERVDARGWTDDRLEAELAARLHEPFDLGRAVLRVAAFEIDDDELVLLLVAHHVAVDLWSLLVLYDELLAGLTPEGFTVADLPPLPATYDDVVGWQRAHLEGPAGRADLAHWVEQLAGTTGVLDLPFDRQRGDAPRFEGASVELEVDPVTTARLLAVAEACGATPFMALLTAFKVLLHRYTGNEDVVVGSPIAGRPAADFEGIVGYFANALPLRSELSRRRSYREALHAERDVVLAALDHEHLPFAKLVEQLRTPRHPARTPLFHVLFLHPRPHRMLDLGVGPFVLGERGATLDVAGGSVESLPLVHRIAQFDLTLTVVEVGGALRGSLNYDTALFDASTIERMVANLGVLLRSIGEQPDVPIGRLPMLAPDQWRPVVGDEPTGPAEPAEPVRSLSAWVAVHAAAHPDVVAIRAGLDQRTWAGLDRSVAGVAARLRAGGVALGDRVGILLPRSIDSIVAMLACIRVGAAYVPLDPTFPDARLATMVDDAGVRVVLVAGETASRPVGAVEALRFDDSLDPGAAPVPDADGCGGRLPAVLIYTSGSTGVPKGVVLTHGGLQCVRDWAETALDPDERRVVLASASFNFDVSIFETLVSLSLGSEVCLVENLLHVDGLPDDSGVTLVQGVPTPLAEVLRRRGLPRSTVTVFAAGEPLPGSTVDALLALDGVGRVLNMYGPAEDTVYSTAASFGAPVADPVPIGRPLPGKRVWVLDPDGGPVPPGVQGEVYIGGPGTGLGYTRARLTAERFLPDPFATEPGARLYRSGDIARVDGDGRLVCAGRVDHQVKVRGHRIELLEVEIALRGCSGVAEAAASVSPVGGGTLVAYLVPTADGTPVIDELKLALGRRLPPFMVPNRFVLLDRLPTNRNGKVDRQALPPPDGQRVLLGNAYVAPVAGLEAAIAAIWARVLELDEVGATDNFFDVGGHSLLMTQVADLLEQELGITIKLVDLFRWSTVRELAQALEGQPGDGGADADDDVRARAERSRQAFAAFGPRPAAGGGR